MIELAALVAGAFVIFVVGTVVLTVVKCLLWLILLPLRLIFGVLILPALLLLKTIGLFVGGLLLLIAGVATVIGLAVAAVALVAAGIVPLLPLVCVVFVVWLVIRSTARPAATS